MGKLNVARVLLAQTLIIQLHTLGKILLLNAKSDSHAAL